MLYNDINTVKIDRSLSCIKVPTLFPCMIGEREGVMYDQARVSGSLKCGVIKGAWEDYNFSAMVRAQYPLAPIHPM